MKHTLFASASIALTLASTASLAQVDFYRRVIPQNVNEGGVVGAVFISGSEYQGSNKSRLQVLPIIEYQWSNGFFAGVTNGLGYNASSSPDLAYGARVTLDFGRKESRSLDLRGLGDVSMRPEFGAFFNVTPAADITLNSALRFGNGDNRDGLLVDIGASWSTLIGQRMRLSTSAAATWANSKYQQSYFGVNTKQSLQSAYRVYTPDAGLRDARIGLSLSYRLTPTWGLTSVITHTELMGDAKRSPIVRDRGVTSAVLALSHSF